LFLLLCKLKTREISLLLKAYISRYIHGIWDLIGGVNRLYAEDESFVPVPVPIVF
jgi:hypothetical protein